jgi:hypothetical protein
MSDLPVLMIKGTLLAHGPLSIRIKPEAFSGEKAEFCTVVSAMLPNLRPDQFYEVLAGMGRQLFETYFRIEPNPDAEVNVEELWQRVDRLREAGLL